MNNSHDEIKRLLKASRTLLSGSRLNEEVINIKSQYGIITEQGEDDDMGRFNVGKSIENTIGDTEDEYETYEGDNEEKEESSDDKKQAYRISGGIVVLHGKDKKDVELTTDEKTAYQETMDEFVNEVSDMVDFNKMNVYPKNVEWSGKIIDFDLDFYFTIGEENGVYVNGKMIKTDEEFIEFVTKLNKFFEKFKTKWARILASRKKTND
jgi:hypothetical protein